MTRLPQAALFTAHSPAPASEPDQHLNPAHSLPQDSLMHSPGCSAGLAWHPASGRGLPDGAAHLATGGADSCAKLWTADGQVHDHAHQLCVFPDACLVLIQHTDCTYWRCHL